MNDTSSQQVRLVTESEILGNLILTCDAPGEWAFTLGRVESSAETEVFHVACDAPGDRPPPSFMLSCGVPLGDIEGVWTPFDDHVNLPPDWGCSRKSDIALCLPLCSLVGSGGTNRLTAVCSEASRMVDVLAGFNEESGRVTVRLKFFIAPEAPLSKWEASVRISRGGTFSQAVQEASAWLSSLPGYAPCVAPPDAFEPLYSCWYSFHQNVKDIEVEAECAEAAALGMRVVIVDDGWQTDDNNRGYAFCGDWEISPRRFPDMAAHVRRVHELGMKYMVWYGLPFVGYKSKAIERYKGKLLRKEDRLGCAVLDPRFPEVRAGLAATCEKAVRDWDIDGLKLDFIDAIHVVDTDPAVAENFAGRDIRSLPEAVDALMRDITERLAAVKPGLLIEFRQRYIGPAIRKYGNMLRAGDCPGSSESNRIRTANLRLTSGATAVHSDMLEWNAEDTPEDAARQILAVLFSTIQYSMMLRRLPREHKDMIRHWIEFTKARRDTLLHGEFVAPDPVGEYPVLLAKGAEETVAAVYRVGTLAEIGADRPVVWLVNSTASDSLCVRLSAAPKSVEFFDTFGRGAGMAGPVGAGLHDLAVPRSGYALLRF